MLSARRLMPWCAIIWLRGSLNLGLQPQVFSSIGVAPSARLIIAGKTNDIVGRLPGAASGPAIILIAHYDSVYSARAQRMMLPV